MILSRKMNLQLTPLLDLLLIVIFAQYLEVEETQQSVLQTNVQTAEERDAAYLSLEATQQEVRMLREELQQTALQEQSLAKLVHEIFLVPEQELQDLLLRRQLPGNQTAAELSRLQERFRAIAVEQPGRVVEHLLTYEEIRKRCDIWDLHVTPENFLILSSGDQSHRMQIPLDISEDFVQQEFIQQFMELVRKFPEQKSLLLALLTYDRRSQRWALQGVRESLPKLMQRLNMESAGRTRYDFADLGFRIE